MSAKPLSIIYYLKTSHRSYCRFKSSHGLSNYSIASNAEHSQAISRRNDVVSDGHNCSASASSQACQPPGTKSAVELQTPAPFFDLPSEIRRIVLDQLFMSCRRDLAINPTITTCNVRNSYLLLYVPEDFLQLFASKQFAQEAASSFIRFTNIDLNNCDANDVLNGTHTMPFLKHILRQVLAMSTHISVKSACNYEVIPRCEENTVQSLSLYVDKIKTINIYTDDRYNWVRRATGRSRVIRNSNLNVRNHTRYIKTTIQELRRCETEKIYPSTLQENLQEVLFANYAFRNPQELVEKLLMTRREAKVYFWMVVYCDIAHAEGTIVQPGLTQTLHYNQTQEPIILVIDVATKGLVHLKVQPVGSLRRFSRNMGPRVEVDDADIEELLK